MRRSVSHACRMLGGLAVVAVLLTGCQTWVPERNLTLPAPHYLERVPQHLPATARPAVVPNEFIAIAQDQSGLPMMCPAPGSPSPSAGASPGPDPYVAEMINVLCTTQSVDAFLATVKLLAREKAEAKRVLPSVIRNAERLGIYGKKVSDTDVALAKRLDDLIAKMGKNGKQRARSASATRAQKNCVAGAAIGAALGAGTGAVVGSASKEKSAESKADTERTSDKGAPPLLRVGPKLEANPDNSVPPPPTSQLPADSPQDTTPPTIELQYPRDEVHRLSQPARGPLGLGVLPRLKEWLINRSGFFVLNQYSSDPGDRTEEIIYQSEDLRQINNEMRRYWMNQQPAGKTVEGVHGDIGP